jgi:Ca2+-binding RTX toxin-like protein
MAYYSYTPSRYPDRSVVGTEGNDSLVGSTLRDEIVGLGGNDWIEGGAGGDFLYGGAGIDTILGGDGDDLLLGGEYMFGQGGNDWLYPAAVATADGGDGNDNFYLNATTGYEAAQTVLQGGFGNDYVQITPDFKSLVVYDGGPGWDVLEYFNYNGPTQGALERVHFSGVEEIRITNPVDDVFHAPDSLLPAGGTIKLSMLRGAGLDASQETNASYWMLLGPASHLAWGGAGNDTIVGAFGALDGGAGNDVIVGAPDLVNYVPLPPSTSYYDATIAGKRDIRGGDDQIRGGTGDDRLNGGMGDDALTGGAGNDTLQGGDGTDAALFSGNSTDYRIETVRLDLTGVWVDDAETGTVSDVLLTDRSVLRVTDLRAGSPDGVDILESIDVLVFANGTVEVHQAGGYVVGTERADKLYGGDGDQQIQAGDGNDTIYGLDGNDAVAAGEGNDLVSGGAGVDTLLGEGGNDTLVGAHWQEQSEEYIDGGAGDDFLFGRGILLGGAGQDTIDISGSSWVVDGGDGNDTIRLGSEIFAPASEILLQELHGGAGDDVVDLTGLPAGSVVGLLDGGEGVDTLVLPSGDPTPYLAAIRNFERLSLSGSVVLPDTFVAIGGFVNVTMLGYGSPARLDASAESGGAYRVILSGGGAVTTGAGNDLLQVHDGAATLTGGAGDDVLVAEPGTTLRAGYSGRAGDYAISFTDASFLMWQPVGTETHAFPDVFSSRGTVLRITDLRAGSPDGTDYIWRADGSVDLAFADRTTAITFDATDGIVVASGDATAELIGTAGADTLSGGAGNDTLRAGSGNDLLLGGGGNDMLQGEGGNDAIEGGAGNDNIYGGAGDDWMSGGDGNDYLFGDTGSDGLYGGAGDDLLTDWEQGGTFFDGGDGNDTLAGAGEMHGGAGNDSLSSQSASTLLDAGSGNDTVSASIEAWTVVASPLDARGGTGDDTFVMSLNQAWQIGVDGGTGFDTLRATFRDGKASGWPEIQGSVAIAGGNATVSGASGTQTLHDVERLSLTNGTWALRGAGFDVDRDGFADVLWHNTQGGQTLSWSHADIVHNQAFATVADQNWKIVGAVDHDTSGGADILWRNASTGEQGFWRAGDTTATTILSTLGTDWKVAGVGQFDGTGGADIAWRNTATGENMLWKDASSGTPTTQALATLAAPWQVAAVGDFDGNGQSDLLWRNAATGENTVWQGGDSAHAVSLASLTGTDWKIAGTGDFDGDGHSDLLWRNGTTGQDVLWLRGNGDYNTALMTIDPHWQVVGTGDYDGNGRADLFWRNAGTGQNILWVDGDARLNLAIATVDASWAVPVQTNSWLLPDGTYVA